MYQSAGKNEEIGETCSLETSCLLNLAGINQKLHSVERNNPNNGNDPSNLWNLRYFSD